MQAATLTWQREQSNIEEFDIVESEIGPQHDGVQGQEREREREGERERETAQRERAATVN